MSTETTAPQPVGATMTGPVVKVFEPALCCTTGVCGTDPDQSLVEFTADFQYLRSRGAVISRHNLAVDPQAFVEDPVASAFLRVAGSAGLPLVVVDGVTVATGAYPDRARLQALAGLPAEQAPAPGPRTMLGLSSRAGGCCGDGDGSCC